MKKTILFSLLIATMLISCKHKPSQITKPQMIQRGGELVAQIQGAYDSIHVTQVQIYYLDGVFHCYRESFTRSEADSMGCWTNSEEFGMWSVTGGHTMSLDVPNDSKSRVMIPFNPKEVFYYQAAGLWPFCCDCNELSKCCQANPAGPLGFTCSACPEFGCSACIAVRTDEEGHITGGPVYGFYDSRLTENNFIME